MYLLFFLPLCIKYTFSQNSVNSNPIDIVRIQFIQFIKLIGKTINGRIIPVPFYRVLCKGLCLHDFSYEFLINSAKNIIFCC